MSAGLHCPLRRTLLIQSGRVIGLDGYPEPGTIHVRTAAFPLLEREAQLIIPKCLFKPARYKGVPVRQKIQFTITARP